ncbi:Ltp family lipoprotein [Novosphingobium sp. Leaf2]|uniref:Ltp family lipoprotein n=1 Tax=Novosphingobium sp. Leaf2 TaxID=1735670 RepID=UPI0009E76CE7|nr:Ltp family lipoprotein [Novosphingobium sp. Leaf2]
MNGGSLLPKKPRSNEIACPRCKEPISISAEICPYCRTEFTREEVANRKKEHWQNILGGCILLIVLLCAVTYCSGKSENLTEADDANLTAELKAARYPTGKSEAASAKVEAPANSLTGPQNNAARSAAEYLDTGAFSRDGLIHQLSSEYGAGFDVSDATVAVDSLNVDWNQQAEKSARSYLEMSGFSCSGLIQQLSSDHGAQFTKSQATYGAQQAGAC